MTPTKARTREISLLKIQDAAAAKVKYREPKLEVGDNVRLAKTKGVFEKGYTPNWTQELFKVTEVNETTPVTYRVADQKGEEIKGSFYENELQKSAQGERQQSCRADSVPHTAPPEPLAVGRAGPA